MILTTLLAIATPTILLTTFSPTTPSQMGKMITPPASNFMMRNVHKAELEAWSWADKVKQEHGVDLNPIGVLLDIVLEAERSEGHAIVACAKLHNLETAFMSLYHSIPYRHIPSIGNTVDRTLIELKDKGFEEGKV